VNELAPAEVAASVGRALWGEVAGKLRSVQFRTVGSRIELRFWFEGDADGNELDSIGRVGAEIAADFTDATISEEVFATSADGEIPWQEGWHTAYARKEPSLAR
jgi:hypothetical protein